MDKVDGQMGSRRSGLRSDRGDRRQKRKKKHCQPSRDGRLAAATLESFLASNIVWDQRTSCFFWICERSTRFWLCVNNLESAEGRLEEDWG